MLERHGEASSGVDSQNDDRGPNPNQAYLALRISDIERGSIYNTRSIVIEKTDGALQRRLETLLHELIGYGQ